ncbi:MAG TPA: rhodanese-like domain-containing protein [Acidimicrobiales bacterium]|nr:rhodanese-like domain-containing protein [Acidimicrobiales bacterium]
MSPSADDLVDLARRYIERTRPEELAAVSSAGGLIIDIRPQAQREAEGELPGALVVERNVLEWRLDPSGSHRHPHVTGFDQPVVVVCSAGYASSLAAESLATLGYRHASDLAGGYQAWSAWRESSGASVPEVARGS